MFGKLETSWNPWHGCFRVSEGCKNCFIYSMDSIHKRDTKHICLNKNFEYPLKKRRNGEYHILVLVAIFYFHKLMNGEKERGK